jgi:hypothetical protein
MRGRPDGLPERGQLNFAFLQEPSDTGHRYLLIIKYDPPSYLWLDPAIDADAATTAEELTAWFEVFGVASTWVSY